MTSVTHKEEYDKSYPSLCFGNVNNLPCYVMCKRTFLMILWYEVWCHLESLKVKELNVLNVYVLS